MISQYRCTVTIMRRKSSMVSLKKKKNSIIINLRSLSWTIFSPKKRDFKNTKKLQDINIDLLICLSTSYLEKKNKAIIETWYFVVFSFPIIIPCANWLLVVILVDLITPPFSSHLFNFGSCKENIQWIFVHLVHDRFITR